MLKNYLKLLIKYRKTFVAVISTVTVLAVLVSFLLPKWYLAEASFLAPELTPNMLIGAGSGLSSVIQSFTGQRKYNGYNYLAILNSRTINEAVIRRFDLMKVYGVDDSLMSKALKELGRNVLFTLGENNETAISVYDRKPRRAADMANFYIDLLNARGQEFASKELSVFKHLVEDRIQENELALTDLESKIRAFQEHEKMPLMASEDASGMEAIAGIYIQRMNMEMQRDFFTEHLGKNHPSVLTLETQIQKLNSKIEALPRTSVESLKLYRQFFVRKKVSEFIVPMLEQIKLSELQKIPDVIVLDKAVPPDRKSKPKRVIIILATFFLSSTTTLLMLGIHDKYSNDFRLLGKQARAEWKR